MSKAIFSGIWAVIPAYRIIPLSALHREVGISPVLILLQEVRLQQSLRRQRLDDSYPLKKRTYSTADTRLTQTARILPTSIDPKNITLGSEYRIDLIEIKPSIQEIHVYTDGLYLRQDCEAGRGYIAFQAGQKIISGSLFINWGVEPKNTQIIFKAYTLIVG